MTQRRVTDLAASVRARLLNLARERGEENRALLERFALEGLLRRLGLSAYRENFILKGAMLFRAWSTEPHRPTRDADFLGLGSPSKERLIAVFKEICRIPFKDGVVLDEASVSAKPIRQGQRYVGVRLSLIAHIGVARLPLQADIGFGDDAFPPPKEVAYPALLDFPPPQIRIYARETVVAEKLDAMITHGETNTRIKDFFDLWVLGRRFGFEGPIVAEAIARTLSRRLTGLAPDLPAGLKADFFRERASDWDAFFRRGLFGEAKRPFEEVGEFLRSFLVPPLEAVRQGTAFPYLWPPGGPWVSS